MKSNQERSNECLPPKKRELLATSLAVEEKPVGENLAWLASVASVQASNQTTAEYSSSSSSSSVSLPAVYSPSLPQHTGTIQYTQFVSPAAYTGPYTGYISSQIIKPPSLPSVPHPPTPTAPATPPPPSQYLQLSGTPHLQLHPLPHTLTLAPSQVVLQYTDGAAPKKEEDDDEEGGAGLVNGALQKGRCQQNYESQDASGGLRTSLVLVPNNHVVDGPVGGADKLLVKPVSRASSFTFSPEGTKAAVATVIQAPPPQPAPGEQLHTGFYPTPQTPIIGYLAGGGATQQHQQQVQSRSVSYHATIPQHLLIPGSPSLLLPEPPQAYVTLTTGDQQHQQQHHTATVVQAHFQLPVVSTATPVSAPPTPPPAPPPSLPPYFMKGSIIQLADGELKRVEDLRTEDFIQSAEISGDLRIDSSTVERIEGSQTADSAIIQFAVGEHRAQVSVEVLVEYPFFVFGQGWSSCCPDRTTQLLELSCAKLSVGDVCISLTLKSVKKSLQGKSNPAAEKPTREENGLSVHTDTCAVAHNGQHLPHRPRTEPSVGRPITGRKRRWSAPEGRKALEDPPVSLPKPSFIPQEVKNCIEGRSIIGK